MKKYIIIMILVITLIVGLKLYNRNNDYYLKVSNEAINFFRVSSYDTSLVKKKDREALEEYLSTLTHNNQVINLSDYIIKDSSYYTIDENTKGVYIEDGKCLIKYKDLDIIDKFDDFNYEGEPYQRVICNNYFTYIYDSYFYPSYEETKKDPRYSYVFNKEEEISNGYIFTYKSTFDGSLYKLKFVLEKNTIDSITAIE